MWQRWERGGHHSISNERGLNGGSSRSPGLMVFAIPAVTKIWALQKKFRHFFSCWYRLQAWFSSLLLWYIVFYIIFFNKVLSCLSPYIYKINRIFGTIQKQQITQMRVVLQYWVEKSTFILRPKGYTGLIQMKQEWSNFPGRECSWEVREQGT